jgi:molybdopterin molybdotransferase
MTGAPLPPGADAVIPFEDVDDDTTSISVFKPVPAWSCVRLRGQDLQQGTPLLAAGTAIGAPQLALLAASGSRSVKVTKQPVIAVFSTGNELMDPGEPLAPGQIYNSNTPMLAQAVREAGGEALTLHTVADDRAAIVHAFQSASGSDLIVTSGGASVGDFDYITDIVRQNGSLNFWKVRVRPGKPLVSGTINGTPVIGLPGNPTSAMVTFELFVRPAIRTMLGAPPLRTEIEAVLDERVDNRGGRRTYVRVRLSYADGHFRARLSGPQDSAMLLPLAHADGLLIAPEDQEELIPGDIVTVLVWRLPSPAHARDIQAS